MSKTLSVATFHDDDGNGIDDDGDDIDYDGDDHYDVFDDKNDDDSIRPCQWLPFICCRVCQPRKPA